MVGSGGNVVPGFISVGRKKIQMCMYISRRKAFFKSTNSLNDDFTYRWGESVNRDDKV